MKIIQSLCLMASVVCFAIGAFVPPAYPHTLRLISAGGAFLAGYFLLIAAAAM